MTSIAEIRPFVRYVQLVKVKDKKKIKNLVAYDHRLFFVRDGEGKITVGQTHYMVRKGDLMLWRSGVEYSIENKDGTDMELIGFSFDLFFFNSHRQVPIPPSKANEFRPDEIVEANLSTDLDFFSDVIFFADRHDVEFDLFKIYTEYKNKLRFFEQKISGMFLSVLMDIVRCGEQSGTQSHKNENIDKILELIRENYRKPLTNRTIGEKLGYHPNHVNRLMSIYTGMSLHRYLQNYRIEKAMDFLLTTDMPVMQICEAVGFRDFTHFSKYFKKKTGYTPTAFRRGV